jgi:hypothetical protein
MRRTPALYAQLRNPLKLICAIAREKLAKTDLRLVYYVELDRPGA